MNSRRMNENERRVVDGSEGEEESEDTRRGHERLLVNLGEGTKETVPDSDLSKKAGTFFGTLPLSTLVKLVSLVTNS